MIDQKLNVTNATLVKVPFDLEYWQAEAEKRGPLPEPHSEDPTQWLFQGNVKDSEAPLHVAVARLLGYRWPEQMCIRDSWVSSEWDVTLKSFLQQAQAVGGDSPVVFVFLRRAEPAQLKTHIASYLAAQAVLSTSHPPTTDEGHQARSSLESRQKKYLKGAEDIADRIVADARVFQAGGTEVQAETVSEALNQACQAALLRLFPRFPEADSASWPQVVNQARRSNQSALESTGYQGDINQHPVCREVLNCIGGKSKTGTEIRRCLLYTSRCV